MRRGLLAGVTTLLLCSQSMPGQTIQEPPTGEAYLAAIQAQDWERFGSYLDTEAVYRDDTMEFFGRDAIHLTGRDAIVDFWRTSSEESGTSSIRYEVQNRFAAGTTVVYTLRGTVVVSGEYWEIAQDEIELSFDLVTVLRVSGDQVIHHADYVDYAEGMEQIEVLRTRHPIR